eukprot:gnl/TRDRNA2_/TRDRNA2_125998_c0_seq1.p1 gnl/TRDRNA2_/TRDRNA2_125998_c0~~gnl/TRDRNA2_/TRDRNA2_125998_c0_seq1.p1  ORF type:complete len:533 (-),score=84.52 gnl/TRDRNA2_/TRDRNA2_125998_c0_seq1:78-1676(-)
MCDEGDDGPGLTEGLLTEHVQLGWEEILAQSPDVPEEALGAIRRLRWLRLLRVVSGESPKMWADQLDELRSRYWGKSANSFESASDKLDGLPPSIQADLERRALPGCPEGCRTEGRRQMQRILMRWRSLDGVSSIGCGWCHKGMCDLVAVVFVVCKMGESRGASKLGNRLCGPEHTEADAAMIFAKLMESGQHGMLSDEPGSACRTRCVFIFDSILRTVDTDLHKHLRSLGVDPQVFLIRWIQILFSGEFHISDTIQIWDAIIVDSVQPPVDGSLKYPAPNGGSGGGLEPAVAAARAVAASASAALPLVDYVAVAMLRYVRAQLLEYNTAANCLRRLQKYPPVERVTTFVEMAHVLKVGCSRKGAHSIAVSDPGRGAAAAELRKRLETLLGQQDGIRKKARELHDTHLAETRVKAGTFEQEISVRDERIAELERRLSTWTAAEEAALANGETDDECIRRREVAATAAQQEHLRWLERKLETARAKVQGLTVAPTQPGNISQAAVPASGTKAGAGALALLSGYAAPNGNRPAG